MKITDLFPKKKKIFISYRQETSLDFVNHLADRLDEKFEVYYDQKHSEAKPVSETIMQEIDKCTHFILVVDKKIFAFDIENEKEKDNRLNAEDGKIYDYVLAEIRYVREKNEQKKKNKEDEIKIITLCVPGSEEVIEKFKREKEENKEEDKEENKEENKNEIKTIIKDLLGINRHIYSKSETFDDFFKKFLEQKMGYDFTVERWKKILKIFLLAVFVTALCVFGGTLLQQWISSRTPKLVFAGGGSVANMIKKITGDSVDVKDYKNAIYLNLPSQEAWALMPEEVMINHTSDTVPNKFYPVCLSALKADDSVFFKIVKEEQIKENGTIISYRLKENDELIVYSNKFQGDQKTITIDSLQIILEEWCKNDTSFKVYVTNEKSGTYYSYQKELKVNFDSISYRNRRVYYDEKLRTNELVDSGNKCIILSSRYYTPGDINKFLKSRIVVNDNGESISKPMYLYFAGYRNEDGTITIPEQMVRFLKQIDKDANIKTNMNQKTRKVVTPYDLLETWQ